MAQHCFPPYCLPLTWLQAPISSPHMLHTLHATVDLGDELGVGLRAQHIGVALEVHIGRTVRRCAVLIRNKLRSVDARHLIAAAPVMVADAGHADEKLAELAERGFGETLKVAVDLVVAQQHGEYVHIPGFELRSGKGVHRLKLLIGADAALGGAVLNDLH